MISSLDQLDSLRVLDLSFNTELLAINPSVFKSCKHLRSLNISNTQDNHLFSILKSAEVLKNLEELIVDNNMMGYFRSVPFLPKLKILSMKKGFIRNLDQILFNISTQLEYLDLSHNYLRNMQVSQAWNPHASIELFNLKSLILNNNQFTTLKKDEFVSYKELVLLDLSKNFINEIKYDCFDGLKKLSILLLDDNAIKHIEFNPYSLANLNTLDLSDNLLHSLSNTSFNQLENLQSLILNKNQIIKIETGAFTGLKNLENLNLNNNQLKEFDFNIFLGI